MTDTIDYCTVLRVETAEGEGPYSDLLGYDQIHDDDYSEVGRYGRRPSPYDDGLDGQFGFGWHARRFGFANRKQFERWFDTDEAHQRLHAAGFRLAHYSVPMSQVFHGYKQVVFDKEHAKLINTEALT